MKKSTFFRLKAGILLGLAPFLTTGLASVLFATPSQAVIENIIEIHYKQPDPNQLKKTLEAIWKAESEADAQANQEPPKVSRPLVVFDWDRTLVERGMQSFRPGVAEALSFAEQKNFPIVVVTTRGWGLGAEKEEPNQTAENPDLEQSGDAVSPRNRKRTNTVHSSFFENQAKAIHEKLQSLMPSPGSLLRRTWTNLPKVNEFGGLDSELLEVLGGTQELSDGLKEVQAVTHDADVTGKLRQFSASFSEGVLFSGGFDKWGNSLKGKSLEHLLDGKFGELPFERPDTLIIVDDNLRHLIQFGVTFQTRKEKVYLVWFSHFETHPYAKGRMMDAHTKLLEEHAARTWESLKEGVRGQTRLREREQRRTLEATKSGSGFWSYLGFN